MITLVRTVFVSRPLDHYTYLKFRYQVGGVVAAVAVCGLIAATPSLGLCGVELRNWSGGKEGGDEVSYCSYGDMSLGECQGFYSILLVFGYILPITCVISLYVYIYNVVVRARRSHRTLTETSCSASTRSQPGVAEVEKKERVVIPWSILAILAVYISTSAPWIFMEVFTVDIIETLAEGDSLSVVFDVFYSVLQIIIGCSPLVYLLTTNSLRLVFVRMFCDVVDYFKF